MLSCYSPTIELFLVIICVFWHYRIYFAVLGTHLLQEGVQCVQILNVSIYSTPDYNIVVHILDLVHGLKQLVWSLFSEDYLAAKGAIEGSNVR